MNDINDLITHQVFVSKFKHYFCECLLKENQSAQNVERERKSGKKGCFNSFDRSPRTSALIKKKKGVNTSYRWDFLW